MEVSGTFLHRTALLTAIAAFAIVALTLGGNGFAGGIEDPFAAMAVQQAANPRPAPDVELPDLDGRTVRIKDFVRKVVLLGFFTTT